LHSPPHPQAPGPALSASLLRLATFGGLALTLDGVPLTGPAAQRSRLALLALLAVAGPTGISRDKLLLYLWPENDEERARHALKQAVYSLRREVNDAELILGTTSLRLNPEVIASDVRDFEAALAAGDARAAVAFYTGPFLDGVHLKGSVEFDRWSAEQRGRLALLWSGAVESLATACEAAGAWRDAATHWRSLATAEPLSGRVAAALIRALAESGDVSAALNQYRVHEALMRDELDASPETEVAALADAIKSGTWTRTPPRRAVGNEAPPAAETAPAPSIPRADESTPAHRVPVVHPAVRARPRRQLRWIGYAAVAVTLLGGASGFWYDRLDPGVRMALGTLLTRPRAKLIPRSIVVAALENRTNDSTLDVFGEQAADWLMRALGDANLKVVDLPATNANRAVVKRIPRLLRSRDDDIALAEETSAAYLLTGNYYRDGDSLEVSLSVVDVAMRQRIKSFGPYKGSPRAPDALLRTLVPPALLFLRTSVDSSAGAATTSQLSVPSFEAFERLSRAWERYFTSSSDIARIFAALDTAARLDTSYAAPLLMKGYILDVKEQWPEVDRIVKRVRPLTPSMSRLERATLELLEADLDGNAPRRLAVSVRMREMTPGSAEVPLLVVVSALYVGRVADALSAIAATDPNRGMNLGAFPYWQWRSAAQHAAGLAIDEAQTVRQERARFRGVTLMPFDVVRVMAAADDRDLDGYLATGIRLERDAVAPTDTAAARRELMLFAGRELRAHGHAAHADSLFLALAAEMESVGAGPSTDALHMKADALYEVGLYTRARDAYAAIVAGDSTDFEAQGRLATAAAHAGDSATARRIDRRFAAMKTPFMLGRALRWRASIAAVEGRNDDAIALLEAAARRGCRLIDTPSKLTVHLDGDLTKLQQTPAYTAMLASLAADVVR